MHVPHAPAACLSRGREPLLGFSRVSTSKSEGERAKSERPGGGRGGGCSSAFSQMEEAEVSGDDVGNMLAAASANHGQHGECLWKSASRALTRKHVSCCVNRSRLA